MIETVTSVIVLIIICCVVYYPVMNSSYLLYFGHSGLNYAVKNTVNRINIIFRHITVWFCQFGVIIGTAVGRICWRIMRCVFLILCIRKQFFHRGVKDLCNVHRQFQGWVVLAFFKVDNGFPAHPDQLGQLRLLEIVPLPVFFQFLMGRSFSSMITSR